jgi:streptogramin lyase
MFEVRRGNGLVWLALVSGIVIVPGAAAATERHVPSPYATIAQAVSQCESGDVVIVDDIPGEVDIWSGDGFRNVEVDIAITIKSQSNNPKTCIIDCVGAGRAFLFTGRAASGSVLRGFHIVNGIGSSPNWAGGAILCENGASPTIINCEFSNNRTMAECGGALACVRGDWLGIPAPVISYCTFTSNGGDDWTSRGGALYAKESRPVVTHCNFYGNQASEIGGAIYVEKGGLIMSHSEILGNRIPPGDWVQLGGGGIYLKDTVDSLLRNCLIAANVGSNSNLRGGGIYVEQGEALLENCTIANNVIGSTTWGGGVYVTPYNAPVVLARCIVWGNTGVQIRPDPGFDGTQLTALYSDVQRTPDPYPGTEMENVNPGFLPLTDVGDYFLTQTTACIGGGGVDSAEVGLWSYTTAQDLSSDEGVVDMGYHYGRNCDGSDPYYPDPWKVGVGLHEDCNHNDVPDECDIAEGTSADENQDGIPDECQGCPTPARYAGVADPVSETRSFDAGALVNVENTGETGLRRHELAKPLPFINVAMSGRGTLIRVLTEEWPEQFPGLPVGTVVGEYRTAPDTATPGPSRTAVDLDGNVWVANRADDYGGTGSVTKIGLIIGGQRCNAVGIADPEGEYIKNTEGHPIKYNGCSDRNADGLIHTSCGFDNVLSWPEYASPGSVYCAEDECITHYVRANARATRFVAVDQQNDLWVGGDYAGDHVYDKVDGVTGEILETFPVGYGGYGGIMDCNAVIWSAMYGTQILRWDTTVSQGWQVLTGDAGDPFTETYGVTLDRDGYVWVTQQASDEVVKVDPFAVPLSTDAFSTGDGPKGAAVTLSDNNIWVANALARSVTRLSDAGTFIRTYDLSGAVPPPPAEQTVTPTGLAVDASGMVWAVCRDGRRLARINPNPGQGEDEITYFPTAGQFPAGSYLYNYGNMTGDVTLHATATGTWSVIHDSGKFKAPWRYVMTNTESCADPLIPEGTSLLVEVRASDSLTELSGLPFTPAGCRVRIYDVAGRYLEIRVRLKGTCPGETFQTPVLCDLSVRSLLGDMNCDGALNTFDIDPFVLALTATWPDYAEYYAQFPCCPRDLADVNCDGEVNTFDIDPFVSMLTSDDGCTCAATNNGG